MNTNTSIANCSVSLIGGVPGVHEHNFRADNISIGTFADIDCFRFTGATNVVVNNSRLYGNWDIDANVISGTWNNDQILHGRYAVWHHLVWYARALHRECSTNSTVKQS